MKTNPFLQKQNPYILEILDPPLLYNSLYWFVIVCIFQWRIPRIDLLLFAFFEGGFPEVMGLPNPDNHFQNPSQDLFSPTILICCCCLYFSEEDSQQCQYIYCTTKGDATKVSTFIIYHTLYIYHISHSLHFSYITLLSFCKEKHCQQLKTEKINSIKEKWTKVLNPLALRLSLESIRLLLSYFWK